jgi:hypothetical protein
MQHRPSHSPNWTLKLKYYVQRIRRVPSPFNSSIYFLFLFRPFPPRSPSADATHTHAFLPRRGKHRGDRFHKSLAVILKRTCPKLAVACNHSSQAKGLENSESSASSFPCAWRHAWLDTSASTMRAAISSSAAGPAPCSSLLPCLGGHGRGVWSAAYAAATCLALVAFFALAALDPGAQASSWFLSSSSSSFSSSPPPSSSSMHRSEGVAGGLLLATSTSYSATGGGRNSTGKEVHEDEQHGGDDDELLSSLRLVNSSSGHGAPPELSATPAAPVPGPVPAPEPAKVTAISILQRFPYFFLLSFIEDIASCIVGFY